MKTLSLARGRATYRKILFSNIGKEIRDENTWLRWPELTNGCNILFNSLQEIYIDPPIMVKLRNT